MATQVFKNRSIFVNSSLLYCTCSLETFRMVALNLSKLNGLSLLLASFLFLKSPKRMENKTFFEPKLVGHLTV